MVKTLRDRFKLDKVLPLFLSMVILMRTSTLVDPLIEHEHSPSSSLGDGLFNLTSHFKFNHMNLPKYSLVSSKVYFTTLVFQMISLELLSKKQWISGLLIGCASLMASSPLYHLFLSHNVLMKNFLSQLQTVEEDPESVTRIKQVLQQQVDFYEDHQNVMANSIRLPDQIVQDLRNILGFFDSLEDSNRCINNMPIFNSGLFSRAIAYLVFDTRTPVSEQIHRLYLSHQVSRVEHKGGNNYLAWNIEERQYNLQKLLEMAKTHQIIRSELNIDTALRHTTDAEYLAELQDMLNDEINLADKVLFTHLKKGLVMLAEKHMQHDFWQTSSKFFTGAFGWQLSARCYQLLLNDQFDPNDFRLDDWQSHVGYWCITGIGAAWMLNLGIVLAQYSFAKFDKGIDVSRYRVLLIQLLISVTIADGLWQAIANWSQFVETRLSAILPGLDYLAPLMTWKLFLDIPSLLFKSIHNMTNRVHEPGSGQMVFICNDSFVGLLALLYTSFLYTSRMVLSITQWDFSDHSLSSIMADSLLCALCAVLPTMWLMTQKDHYHLKDYAEDLDGVIEPMIRDDENQSEDRDTEEQAINTVSSFWSQLQSAPEKLARFYDAAVSTCIDCYPR
ncbi:MAG: hypothetical protein CL816_06675 [Coxiellaceae bacterium]|nr:hypothetical protein [Coxiellaceae bacterium]